MVDVFLKFEGGPDARGESVAEGHKDEIGILSFSWGASNPSTSVEAAGLGVSKASITAFTLMKVTDRSSPALFQACCSGARFRSAMITIRGAAGSEYRVIAQYKLEDVLVESFQVSGSAAEDQPSESISLGFAKCTAGYRPQPRPGVPDKPVFGGWDIIANKASSSPLPMR